MKENFLAFLHCLSPFHPGSGTSVSYIDLPVQREVETGLPIMQGSGFKGALRHLAEARWGKDSHFVTQIFGPQHEKGHEHAGAAYFTDLRLLLFPVRSLKKLFTWISSPQVIARFIRDALAFGFKIDLDTLPQIGENEALVTNENELLLDSDEKDKKTLVLEEFAFIPKRENKVIPKIASFIADKVFKNDQFFKNHLKKNLVIVNDSIFRGFTKFSMEVITRIRINSETGTVAEGALWNEENVPAESIFYGFVMASDSFSNSKDKLSAKKIAQKIKELAGVCQFGGNATIGRGLVNLIFEYTEE